MIFRTTFGFVVNPSGFTIFDDIDREDFERRELIYMPGDKMWMSLGVDDILGVSVHVLLDINCVVALGFFIKFSFEFPFFFTWG